MKRHVSQRIVTESLRLEYLDGESRRGSISAAFLYDCEDPYAMSVRFAGPRSITWTFARDLLLGGVYEPTGEGDVHIWPTLNDEGAPVVCIELCSPDGELLLEAPMEASAKFVRRMLSSVPQGDESMMMDLDGLVRSLLRSASATDA